MGASVFTVMDVQAHPHPHHDMITMTVYEKLLGEADRPGPPLKEEMAREITQKEAQEEQQKKYMAGTKKAQEQGVPTAQVSQASNLYYVLACEGISEGVQTSLGKLSATPMIAGCCACARRRRRAGSLRGRSRVVVGPCRLADSDCIAAVPKRTG